MNSKVKPVNQVRESHAYVYCPMCTHTVDGTVVTAGKVSKVKAGQKCSRCNSALDAAVIMRLDLAA